MNVRRRPLAILALGLACLAPAVASASYPAGVWALVEKVTAEPDDKNPNRVRIDGLFMIAKQKPDFAGYPGYSVPAYGYMYYQCSGPDLATCQMEWAELATLAGGEDRCRGWGDSSLADNGSLRTAEPQAMPDAYPLSMGILPGFTPCDALKSWMAENPQESTTGEETSAGESSGGFDSETSTSGAETTSGGEQTSGDASSGGGTTAPEATTNATTPTSGEAETSSTGTGAGSESTSGPADTGALDDDKKGCGCSSRGASGPIGALAPVLGLLALRRRRSA